MKKNAALIYSGLLGLMVILAMFVGLVTGDKLGYKRGAQETAAKYEAAIQQSSDTLANLTERLEKVAQQPYWHFERGGR